MEPEELREALARCLYNAKHDADRIAGLEQENARLRRQVDELKGQPDALTAYLYADTLRRDDLKKLKEHIERLTKAGDAMAELIKPPEGGDTWIYETTAFNAWNKAKGGQP